MRTMSFSWSSTIKMTDVSDTSVPSIAYKGVLNKAVKNVTRVGSKTALVNLMEVVAVGVSQPATRPIPLAQDTISLEKRYSYNGYVTIYVTAFNNCAPPFTTNSRPI